MVLDARYGHLCSGQLYPLHAHDGAAQTGYARKEPC